MTDIPSEEPKSVRAGDLVQWTKSFEDYPASDSWALNYYLSNRSAQITFAGSADGDDFAISVAASTTTGWTAGVYRWQARISLSTEIYTVGEGIIQIYPDMSLESSGLAVDGADAINPQLELIFWQNVRANCLDLIDGKVLQDNQSYSIAGRSLNKYSFDELMNILDRIEVKIAIIKRRLGIGKPGTIKVQF